MTLDNIVIIYIMRVIRDFGEDQRGEAVMNPRHYLYVRGIAVKSIYRLNLTLLLILALFLILPSILNAQNSWEVFTTDNSQLPHNTINGITVDVSGNVWIATTGGLAKYDRQDWQVYLPDNSGIPSTYVSDIAIDADNRKWISTNAGVGVLSGNEWEVYTKNNTNSGLKNDWVSAVAVDNAGIKWFGTEGSAVMSYDDTHWNWYHYDTTPELTGYWILGVNALPDGSVWISHKYGVTKYFENNWTHYGMPVPGYDPDKIEVMKVRADTQGHVYAVTRSHGIWRYDGNEWSEYTITIEGNTLSGYGDILFENGLTAVGTLEGLAISEGSGWTLYDSTNSPLPANYINSFATDGDGNLWIGTWQGLAVYTTKSPGVTITVDDNLFPDITTIPGYGQEEREVGVIVTPDGTRLHMVVDEVVMHLKSMAEAEEVVKRWDGVVISDGAIPEPGPNHQFPLRDIPSTDGYYLFSVSTNQVDTGNIAVFAEQAGLEGAFLCSSEEVLKQFALVLEEKALFNSDITFNAVGALDQCFATSTQEYPYDPSAPNPSLANEGYMDAYLQVCFNDPGIDLLNAWQLMELFGNMESVVPLCVIDAGFIMNDDFPSYAEYDFVDDDRWVDAHEDGYHGTGCISIACAEWKNRFGSVGTGAPVTWPMAFRAELSMYTYARALRTAVAWGAEVVSMSVHFDWGVFAWMGGGIQFEDAIDEAYDHEVVCLAAAGNQGHDLRDVHYLPAEGGSTGKHPIVVGAIDVDTKRAIRSSDGFGWSSCYGLPVDIYAPGGGSVSPIITTPDPNNPDFRAFGGTSCATPYVAGIVAMMRAVNPGITVDQVHDIIRDTAINSADTRVSPGYIDAYAAVRDAIYEGGGIDPWPDSLEPAVPGTRVTIAPGTYCGNLSASDLWDEYWFYIDDFRHLTIDYNVHHMWDIDPLLNSPTIGSERLPFDDNVTPNSYYLTFENLYDWPSFYSFEMAIGAPLAMAPDRFEPNDARAFAGEIVYSSAYEGSTVMIEDLSFHVSGDPDFYELVLPSLPSDYATGYDELVTIYAEPDSIGTFTTFQITVYDEDGTAEPFGRACNLEEIRDRFPSGRIRFLVEDYMEHRNCYRLEIGYDRERRGVDPGPMFDVMVWPDWLENVMAVHPSDLPSNRIDGVPLPMRFPSAPETMEMIMSGQPPAQLPPERLVLKWEEQDVLVLDIAYSGSSGNMDMWLIDAAGDRMATAQDIGPLPGKASQSEEVRKSIAVPGLERGIYGIEVSSDRYPIDYTLSFNSGGGTGVNNTNPEERASALILKQNIPNPFNPTTTIYYILGERSDVEITIYNVSGQLVARKDIGMQLPGMYRYEWDASNYSAGVYVCVVRSEKQEKRIKMLLMK